MLTGVIRPEGVQGDGCPSEGVRKSLSLSIVLSFECPSRIMGATRSKLQPSEIVVLKFVKALWRENFPPQSPNKLSNYRESQTSMA
jgi:hypothetical protein